MQKQLRHSDLLYQKRNHRESKKQLSRCGGKIEENPKREIKRRIKAPLKRKRLTPSGEKVMRKTRMEVTECKNSFAIRIYCIKKEGNINYEKQQKLESNKTSKSRRFAIRVHLMK